jgi:hypothetical protein
MLINIIFYSKFYCAKLFEILIAKVSASYKKFILRSLYLAFRTKAIYQMALKYNVNCSEVYQLFPQIAIVPLVYNCRLVTNEYLYVLD